MERIIRKNKNRKEDSYFQVVGVSQKDGYKFAHLIESDEEEYVITAKIILPKTSKMIEKMKKINKSPITQMLEEIERQRNKDIKEGKMERSLYEIE